MIKLSSLSIYSVWLGVDKSLNQNQQIWFLTTVNHVFLNYRYISDRGASRDAMTSSATSACVQPGAEILSVENWDSGGKCMHLY